MSSQTPYRLDNGCPEKLQPGDIIEVTLSPSRQLHRRKNRAFAEMTVIKAEADQVVASGKGVGSARFTWCKNPWSDGLVNLGYHGWSPCRRYMFWFKSRPENAQ